MTEMKYLIKVFEKVFGPGMANNDWAIIYMEFIFGKVILLDIFGVMSTYEDRSRDEILAVLDAIKIKYHTIADNDIIAFRAVDIIHGENSSPYYNLVIKPEEMVQFSDKELDLLLKL